MVSDFIFNIGYGRVLLPHDTELLPEPISAPQQAMDLFSLHNSRVYCIKLSQYRDYVWLYSHGIG